MEKQEKTNLILVSVVALLIGIIIGNTSLLGFRMNHDDDHHDMHHDHMTMDDHRMAFLNEKEEIIGTLIEKGEYSCCLEKPCTYCIEKTPGHGEGATCSCLEDVVNGVHPCGECIGEILEGHGNKFLSEYFPEAIAEEVGMHHLATIEQIIDEKYGNVE